MQKSYIYVNSRKGLAVTYVDLAILYFDLLAIHGELEAFLYWGREI